MAELHVQRKRSGLSWFWVLLILIVIAAGFYLYLHYKDPKAYPVSSKSTTAIKHGNISATKTIQV